MHENPKTLTESITIAFEKIDTNRVNPDFSGLDFRFGIIKSHVCWYLDNKFTEAMGGSDELEIALRKLLKEIKE